MADSRGRKPERPPSPYPDVPAQPSFPELEERVLARWRKEKTFERSVAERPAGANGQNEFVFYDGPPFANGLPHFGHLLTSYVKDIVPRYQTLRGRRVERRFGWDCHGLPAELEAEKELGIAGRKAILEYGIQRFNDYCRSSVLRYTEQWRETVTRAGRWVDFQHDYKTMDLSYMESVMWAFARLHEKGLLYEGTRVLAYSWAAETPVSNFETRLDDSFRERQDPAITVRFELEPDGDPAPTELWAWTTTPWTLPSNLALAVGPTLEYAVFERDGRRVILGAACAEKYAKELAGAERVGTLTGRALVERRYRPLFPFFANTPHAFRVLAGAFVDVAEGTGVVHLAPGFGEDDLELCRAEGIPVVVPVDESGRFTSEVADWAGERVFDANPKIIRALKERGALVRHETIVHNYPHCWRTDEPLIYRAMDSWYVKVSAFRERMVELNQQIRWIPGHIRDGLFGNWLENARDWSITRNRFWGSPIPVWKSDSPEFPRVDVYGSLDALEQDFGVRPDDLHRPGIDALVRPNPDDPSGKAMMRRVPDVLDVWFDSGSMPFAQVHYPFENRDWFEHHFPADFIVEYAAQTRGWFYTLMVLATALFDRPPFKTCICHGVAVDERGQKLSKRLRNYPEPEAMFAKHGSDALRWYLVSSPVLRGGELRVEKEGKPIADVVRNVLLPIWNAWHFFALYANTDGMRARPTSQGASVLDRYLLAKTRAFVVEIGARMDEYDIAGACQSVLDQLEALNNWYIRRSRARFWKSEKDADKQAAYDTLHTALTALCRVASPLLPFLTDEVYRGLSGGESVHLADWPDPSALPDEPELVRDMDRVRDVCSTALGMRRAKNVRVRQPLAALTVAGPGAERLRPYLDLIEDEVNVKRVELSEEIGTSATFKLQLNARVLGPRLGPEMKKALAAAKAGAWTREGDAVVVAGQRLEPGEYTLLLEAGEGVAATATASGEMIVVLDFTLSEALVQEGLARDLVRVVQQARRDAGLHVADRIRLSLQLPEATKRAVRAFSDYVRENTLASELDLEGRLSGPGVFQTEAELGGGALRVALSRASGAGA
jgi:isoleucyl-tRNA synthetase